MYVIDITRDGIDDDVLLGKDSMDTKRKMMKYVTDYVFANHNIYLDKDTLDQGLDINNFSLKEFMFSNFQKEIDKDLIIISCPTSDDYMLYVKCYDERKDKYPKIYFLHNSKYKIAKALTKFFVNDYLILKHHDNLKQFNNRIIKLNPDFYKDIDYYADKGFVCGTISLAGGKNKSLINKLLNEDVTMKQMRHSYKGKIDI